MNFSNIKCVTRFFSENDKLTIVKRFQEANLLPKNWRCTGRNCRKKCVLHKTSMDNFGYLFYCKKCKKRYSIRKNTFFENIHMAIEDVMWLLYAWSSLCPAIVASRMLVCRKASVVQMYRFFRDITSWKLLQIPEAFYLGGEGHTVQIDESVVTRRKYNVGRIIPQVWVLGMVDTCTKKGVVVYIENRSAETLINEIYKYVLPGTEIWTDMWSGYSSLNTLGGVSPYIHKSVNHSSNFVDPATGVCTNHIEGYWSLLKGFCRKLHVINSPLLPEHIDHFMWYKIYGGEKSTTFNNIVTHIAEKYNC